MKSLVVGIATALLLAVIAYVLLAHVFISEETRIERQIQRGRKAIEDEAILTIASLVAVDYRDDQGHDRSALLAGLRSFFQTVDEVLIGITSMRVTVTDSRAEVSIQFRISGTLDSERFSGLGSRETETVQLRFSKRAGSWQLVGAAWRDRA